jgi:predicted MFS family arabinose efflux permease
MKEVLLRKPLPLVAAVMLCITGVSFMRGPLLPEIGRDLALSAAELSLITTAFALGRLVTDLPAGHLADRIAAPLTLAGAAIVVAVFSSLMALAQALGPILLCVCAIGVASALTNTTGMKVFSTRAPPGARGRAMAMFTTALMVGQMLGPALGGVLADLGSWRTAQIAAFVICAGAATACIRYAREEAAEADPPAKPAAETEDHGDGLSAAERVAVSAVGFSTFFAFGALPLTLVAVIGSDELGVSATAIGAALAVAAVARMVGGWAAGAVSDKVSRKAALIPTLAIMAGSVALLALPLSTGLWVTAVVLIALFSSGNSIGATIVADRTPASSVGRRLGGYRLTMDAGLLTGPAVAGLLYEHSGRTPAMLVVTAVLLTAAVLAAALLREGPAAHAHDPVADAV